MADFRSTHVRTPALRQPTGLNSPTSINIHMSPANSLSLPFCQIPSSFSHNARRRLCSVDTRTSAAGVSTHRCVSRVCRAGVKQIATKTRTGLHSDKRHSHYPSVIRLTLLLLTYRTSKPSMHAVQRCNVNCVRCLHNGVTSQRQKHSNTLLCFTAYLQVCNKR